MLVTFERAPRSQSRISDISDFERGLERFFGDFLESPTPRLSFEYPSTDVRNHEKEIELVAELPGLQKDQVQISVHKGVLTISGERKAAELPESERETFLRRESEGDESLVDEVLALLSHDPGSVGPPRPGAG